jgi:2-phospho-L-lactate/phosphoenolpyruvate guanylyltransferase
MPTLVVPYRGAEGKSRLGLASSETRELLARAMLADVLAACCAVGATFLVTSAAVDPLEATVVPDPGGGQGNAVRAGLDAAVAAGGTPPFLVVNADLPCVTPRDLFALAGVVPEGGLVFAAAEDGTTNALGLASSDLFVPLYGPGSAARYAALPGARSVDSPNLRDDVDLATDLELLEGRLGAHSVAALEALGVAAGA